MVPYQKLPCLNAVLNGTSAVCLSLGYAMIRLKKIALHRLCMAAAFLTSSAFLCSYLTYHARVGIVHFKGTGWVRPIYFSILTSHTVLAILILPLALRTLYLARRQAFDRHARIARWTLPLWLYVSVTGVVIYFMLYRTPS